MQAIITAGGRGERLRPLTDKLPKPLIDVRGKPVLEHIIDQLRQAGIDDLIITVCYLAEKITSFFGDGKKFGVKISYIFEDRQKPLGTAGGVTMAKKFVTGPFIVTSGDVLRKLDIRKMITYHRKKKAFATLNVYKRFGLNPKSLILFDKNGKVSQFVERPMASLISKVYSLKSDFVWANGSFYVFEPEILEYIPKRQPSDFGRDIFPDLLDKNKRLFAFPTDSYFIDIGNLEKLEKARRTFKV